MVAKRRKVTCRATTVVWFIITVWFHIYPVIYMFNVAGGHGRYYTKTCMYMYMYCILVYTQPLVLFMFVLTLFYLYTYYTQCCWRCVPLLY